MLISMIPIPEGICKAIVEVCGQGKAYKILAKIHEEDYGPYVGDRVLVKKVLRRLRWPTLLRDALVHVRKCSKCQLYSPKIHAIATNLYTIVEAISFVR